MYLQKSTVSEDTDQPAYGCILIRIFTAHLKKCWVIGYHKCAQQSHLSDCIDLQAYLSIHWMHMLEGTFSHFVACICLFVLRFYGPINPLGSF